MTGPPRASTTRTAGDPAPQHVSIWPHVEERVVDLIDAAPLDHRLRQLPPPRRAADRPAQRDRRRPGRASRPGRARRPPAQIMAQSRRSPHGADAGDRQGPPRLGLQGAARADRGRPQARPAALRGRHQQPRARHRHGRGRPGRPDRVAAERRQRAAAGRPRRPPGRRDRPAGVLFPKHRGDLAQTAVAVERMRTGAIESLRVPANPLDVLAQQVVAATALDAWDVDELFDLVRRSAPFAAAPAQRLRRHPRPARRPLPLRRVRRAAAAHRLGPRHRHASPAGPARSGWPSPAAAPSPTAACSASSWSADEGPGRRVGELDEEMVYESRVGDVFALGATSWRIEDITHDRVLVTPAPGVPGRLPFWKGDTLGRPAELGAAIGAFTRELAALPDGEGRRARRARTASTSGPPATWSATSPSRSRPPTCCPATRTLLVERFRDELGDWRLVRALPLRHPRPRARGRWRSTPGCASATASTARPIASDDGIVIRIPETDAEPPGGEVVVFEPDEIERAGHQRGRRLGAVRLPLPRVRRPGPAAPAPRPGPALARCGSSASASAAAARGRRASTPRSRSCSRPSASASRTSTTCPPWSALMRRVDRREVQVVDVATTPAVAVRPQPAVRLRRPVRLRGRLPHRRAPGRRALPRPGPAGRAARPGRAARAARPRGARRGRGRAPAAGRPTGGPATPRASPTCCACSARSPPTRSPRARSTAPTSPGWLADAGRPRAGSSRSGWPARSAGPPSRTSAGCATGSACRSRPAPPTSSPSRSTTRWPTWSPATPAPTARSPPTRSPRRLGLGAGRRPPHPAAAGARRAGCSTASSGPAGVRRRVVRRRGAAPAAAPLAGPAAQGGRAGRARGARPLPRGLAARHAGAAAGLRGVDGVLARGRPAGRLRRCRPRRSSRWCCRRGCATTSRRYLDELTSSGEVLWAGHAALPGTDGWVSLHLADQAPLTLPRARARSSTPSCTRRCSTRSRPAAPGSSASSPTPSGPPTTGRSPPRCGTWSGPAGSATTPSPRSVRSPGPARTDPPQPPAAAARSAAPGRMPARTGPPETAGRWALLPALDTDPTRRAHATAERLLDRHGVVTRGRGGQRAGARRVRRASTRCSRRSRTPAAAGAATSSTGSAPPSSAPPAPSTGCAPSRETDPDAKPVAVALAATDPANPYGAALPWPAGRRGRRAAATAPAARRARSSCSSTARSTLYVERGGRTLLTWTDDPDLLAPAAEALADAARRGALGRLTVEKADGAQLLGARRHPAARGARGRRVRATPQGLAAPCLRATPSGARRAASTGRSPATRSPRTDFRVPAARHRRPRRRHRRPDRLARQAPAHPDRRRRSSWTLHTHLKMEGAWHVYEPGQRWRRPAHQARVVLADRAPDRGRLLPRHRRADPPPTQEHDVVGHLGPDLLGPDWDEDEALRRLLADTRPRLGEALLDQTCLAGIGNMYAAELCFVSGVHPLTPVGEVPDLPRLVRRAQQMLEQNKQRGPADHHRQPARAALWVYRRDKGPCRRCGTPIEVGDAAGPTGGSGRRTGARARSRQG